jgi:hypothetical protein
MILYTFTGSKLDGFLWLIEIVPYLIVIWKLLKTKFLKSFRY